MKDVDRRRFLATTLGATGCAALAWSQDKETKPVPSPAGADKPALPKGAKPEAAPRKGTPDEKKPADAKSAPVEKKPAQAAEPAKAGGPLLARQPGEDDASFGKRLLGVEFLTPAQRKLAHLFHRAYPKKLEGLQIKDGLTRVGFRDLKGGFADLVFEDGREKSFAQREENPDLADTLHDSYPDRLSYDAWPENFDPGRYRVDEFFKALYGATEREVASQLVTVNFCGHKVKFNKNNGAAEALEAVGAELEGLKAKVPVVRPYLSSMGGTFAWRTIAGTSRLSAHSYAVSIDLNPDLGGYWRWEKKASLSDMARRRKYPEEIVSVFEKHKFIWGGKWYHFDLMHFEYRPEFFG